MGLQLASFSKWRPVAGNIGHHFDKAGLLQFNQAALFAGMRIIDCKRRFFWKGSREWTVNGHPFCRNENRQLQKAVLLKRTLFCSAPRPPFSKGDCFAAGPGLSFARETVLKP